MIIELLAGAGFLISSYIFYKVQKQQELVCPIGKDCSEVVASKYRSLLGIRNDILGMLYYAAIFIVAFFALPVPKLLMLIVSGAAAITGIVLLGIQSFVLRKWCDYCIASSVISIAIFVVQLAS